MKFLQYAKQKQQQTAIREQDWYKKFENGKKFLLSSSLIRRWC